MLLPLRPVALVFFCWLSAAATAENAGNAITAADFIQRFKVDQTRIEPRECPNLRWCELKLVSGSVVGHLALMSAGQSIPIETIDLKVAYGDELGGPVRRERMLIFTSWMAGTIRALSPNLTDKQAGELVARLLSTAKPSIDFEASSWLSTKTAYYRMFRTRVALYFSIKPPLTR